jgi:N-acetyl-1-D-myo-inositol-2-amino-2-deoxy-alpha-D-glucopyranoside deacetylase/mycothiol S-conjugate amidase
MPLFGRDPRKWGRNRDIDLTELIVDFPVHARLDIRSVADIKREASEQHASQGGGQMRRGWMGFFMRLLGEREEYMQAYPPVTGHRRVKLDLFDGI